MAGRSPRCTSRWPQWPEFAASSAGLAELGCAAIDLETASLYAVADKCGLAATSLHLVSDNPFLGDTNPEASHVAAFPELLALAARVALDE